VSLTTREFELLVYLADRAGCVVSREELLCSVWGYSAAAQTRAVDSTVVRLRRKLERDPRQPDHLHTVFGEGYRLVVPVRSTPPSDDSDPLVGRDTELATLEEMAANGGGALLVVGPGGVGKTRLARAGLARLAERFAGRAWFCSCAADRSADHLVRRVSEVLGLQTPTGPTEEAALRVGRVLRARGPCLLVLDNLEQLAEVATPVLKLWLEGPGAPTILVTSRVPLTGLRGAKRLRLQPLSSASGVELLCLRARQVDPAFDLQEPDQDVATEIVGMLDGLPLAIELAAARLRVLSLSELRDRLEDRFGLLRDRRGEHPDRHSTLHEVLLWSWTLARPADRRALEVLAVFDAPFDLDAAEALLGPEEQGANTVLDRMEDLVDTCWLQIDHRDAPRQFRFMETVRIWLRRRFEALADRDEICGRHARWYASIAEQVADRGDDLRHLDAAPLARHEDDMLGAFRWVCSARLPGVTPLASTLHSLLIRRGPWALHHEILTLAAQRAPTEAEQGRFLCHLACLLRRIGDLDAAVDALQRASARIESSGEVEDQSLLEWCWALQHRSTGDDAIAERHAQKALVLAERANAPARARAAHSVLGYLARHRGDFETARIAHQAALEIARGLGLSHALELQDLGTVAMGAGRHRDAERLLQRARTELEAVGDDLRAARCAANLAALALRRGELDTATPRLEEVVSRFRALGDRYNEAIAHTNLAACHLAAGQDARAAAAAEQGRALAAEFPSSPVHSALMLFELMLEVLDGDDPSATQRFVDWAEQEDPRRAASTQALALDAARVVQGERGIQPTVEADSKLSGALLARLEVAVAARACPRVE